MYYYNRDETPSGNSAYLTDNLKTVNIESVASFTSTTA
jgi:hypothetical protein